jgi:hypothetical protein
MGKHNNRITVAKCYYPEDQYKRERSEKVATGLAIVLGLLPWGYSMPVAYKWPLWAIMLVSLSYLSVSTIPLLSNYFTAPVQRLTFIVGVLALSVATFWPVMRTQWKTENSLAVEGELHPRVKLNQAPQKVIGVATNRYTWAGDQDKEMLTMLYDAGLRIDVENNEVVISTPIRDRFGHLLATIDRNHWRVTPACLDKNYTSDSLEVLDSRGHVVFQMTALSDRVQLQGEWRDEFGNGVRLFARPDGGVNIGIWHDSAMEQKIMELIRPMFNYPSINHWGELKRIGD